MKKGRFSEEKIIEVLREAEAGAKTVDVCRRHGISRETFYRWRKRYGGLEVILLGGGHLPSRAR